MDNGGLVKKRRWIMARRILVLSLAFCSLLAAQFTYEKVELLTPYGAAKEGSEGSFAIDADRIRFVRKNGSEYFSIPSRNVSTVLYSRTSGRRYIMAAAVTWTALLWKKHKKHYMVLVADGEAIEFQLDKSNYGGILTSVERARGLTLLYNQGELGKSSEGFAQRAGVPSVQEPHAQGMIEIKSVPEDAQIEIDGTWIGNSPRSLPLHVGEYAVRIKRRSYKAWVQKISIAAGDLVSVTANLEKEEDAQP